MNLRNIVSVLLVAITVAVVASCAKEQPAAKAKPKEPGQPTAQDSGIARAGGICDTVAQAAGPAQPSQPQRSNRTKRTLPRLVDLGRGTCIPCKKMAPILSELAEEYKGRAIVEVVDLRERPQAAQEYGIKLIPTQIFFDSTGTEVWRHEGFLPKDQIVAKLGELGAKPK
ncbi:MAG TPA: thioredoxin family protein [bacterium]|nr:thioredoxin family protein [bacterium]